MFFSFWVLLGSSGVPSGVLLGSGVLLVFFSSSGVLLVFDNTEERPSRTRLSQKKTGGLGRGCWLVGW